MKNFSNEKKEFEGFSLIELVVVVAVLSVLSAISIPIFNCVTNKAKAVAALTALKQINTDCQISKLINQNTFTRSNLKGYTLQGENCDGSNSTGLITAIPDNEVIMPTLNLWTGSQQITYNFKGRSGSEISECLAQICLTGDSINSWISNENNSQNNSNSNGDAPTGCNYVAPETSDRISLNRAKWMLHMCEEARQNVSICQHPYVYANPQDSPSNYGPPFPMVPCSSLCNEITSGLWHDTHCGDNAFKKPVWLEDTSADNWSINAHADGQSNGDSLIEVFKNAGWYSYD